MAKTIGFVSTIAIHPSSLLFLLVSFQLLRYHTPDNSQIMARDDHAQEFFKLILASEPGDLEGESLTAYGECVDMDQDEHLMNQIGELKFDLAIVDNFPLASCLFFVPLKFNIPFITVLGSMNMDQMRVPSLPSFVPFPIFEFSDAMSFTERVTNFLFMGAMSIPWLSPFPAMRNTTLLEKYRRDPELSTWNTVSRMSLLFMLHRGPILEYPVPIMPNIILIECLTCKPAQKLPAEIEALVESAEGIVIVSFGSGVDNFPDEFTTKFLTAFSQRKELFFWRFKGRFPGKVPPNVKAMKWLPQNDLLANPKAKLFITHSGNNGQYESVYHGVPMLAFPLFAEQPHNALRIEHHGYGLRSNIKSFTVQELVEKMTRIIEEPAFTERTQKAGRILKSKPMNAQQTSVYWIEHVLEFGADHLRSHALDMPWYSFYMVDILLCVLVLLSMVGLAFIGICYFLCRWLRSTSRKHKVE